MKEIVKRIVQHLIAWYVDPLYKRNQQLEAQLEEIKRYLEQQGQTIIQAQGRETQNKQDILQLRKHNEEQKAETAAMAREISRTKWKLIDYMEKDIKHAQQLSCPICGYCGNVATFQLYQSTCAFGGGELLRHQCPQCGVIFGPEKFRKQSPKEFDDDYVVHYLGYAEGDSTGNEMRAFYMLNPKKECTYLNYGCGAWSRSLELLHEQGYQVYGYEPYASADQKSPYLITSRDELKKMKFHGIYSNNLLEHLLDPAAELKFMRTLLVTPGAKMSHCTPCYFYKYEYTRFHTFFFTGDSMRLIAEQAGLKIMKEVNDEANDFYCKLYQQIDDFIDYTTQIYVNEKGEKLDDSVVLQPGGIAFGPYLSLPAGQYHIELRLSGMENSEQVIVKITTDSGRVLLLEKQLGNGIHILTVELARTAKEWEVVTENSLSHSISVNMLRFVTDII